MVNVFMVNVYADLVRKGELKLENISNEEMRAAVAEKVGSAEDEE